MTTHSSKSNPGDYEYELLGYEPENIFGIGYIQDVGCILALSTTVSTDGIVISSVSENIFKLSSFQGKVAKDLIGKSPIDVFEPEVMIVIQDLLNRHRTTAVIGSFASGTDTTVQTYSPVILSGTCMCCSLLESSNANTYVFEFEEISPPVRNLPNQEILLTGNMVARIQAMNSIVATGQVVCDSLMVILPGYDRGMVIRFSDDMSAEVIYENIRDCNLVTSSYMNMRFPAGDIPPIARQLMMKSKVRFVYDVCGENSSILSMTNERLDLSMSSLRGCTQCHLDYLRNIGVTSTLIVSIIVSDKLWGYYALHSYSGAVKPTAEQRIMLSMISSISAMRIDHFQVQKCAQNRLEMNSLMMSIPINKDIKSFFKLNYGQILRLFEAELLIYEEEDSVPVYLGDDGIAPTLEGWDTLSRQYRKGTVLALSSFSDGLKGMGAGVLFFMHADGNASARCALIRRSRVVDVQWAGNPDPVRDLTVPGRLSPRASFNLYMEKAHKEARAWSAGDLELANFFFERVTESIHSKLLTSFRLSLEQSNAECIKAIKTAKKNYEFFAHMSHELRTPFHGVISSLQILQSSADVLDTANRDDIISSALESGKTMLRTLDDILLIAKSRNNIDTTKTEVLVQKIGQETIRIMTPIAERKNISLSLHEGVNVNVPPITLSGKRKASELETSWSSIVVSTDYTRVGQILNNLVNNAIKFTANGGKVAVRVQLAGLSQVCVRWEKSRNAFESCHVPNLLHILDDAYEEEDSDNGSPSVSSKDYSSLNWVEGQCSMHPDWYILEVEDSGCGVGEHHLTYMFQAYKQLSSGVTKTFQGTGLGLHICSLHVHALGGVVGVASTVNKGTLFFVAIPMTIEKYDQPGAPPTAKQASSAVKPSAGYVPTIPKQPDSAEVNPDIVFVVVDDSKVNLRLTKQKIQLSLGKQTKIETFEDGVEVIDYYKECLANSTQSTIGAILMDYHMPRCSGKEAIIEIRRLERTHSVAAPVFIMAFTADLMEGTRADLLSAGANDILPKPTPTGVLEALCREQALKP